MSIAKGTVHQHARDGVALLTIDAPPVNALSHPVRKALCDALRRAIDDAAITAVVLAGANRAFVAGADLSELGAPLAHPDIRELFAAVDACPKPVVAAIGGMALGGGLELALCCDRRVAASHASLGLPEVTLGLLPGGGGTQRLPRLLGLEEAANLILTGKILPARRAAALGIVDEVVEGDEVEAAVEWARELGQRGPSALRRLGRMPMPTAGRGPVTLLAEAYAAAVRRMPRRFALEMIVQCLEAAATAPDFAAGMAVEAACFEQCHAHPQHRALLHLFFAERACAKLPGVGRDVEARPVRTAVLVGGGAHAEGLAASLVEAGVELLEPARLREADVVLATGDDEPAARREALARIDREARPGALLVAVGTALDLDALAQAVHRPAELVGLDLGLTSPSSRARLVQVIRGSKTGAEALVTAMRLGKRLGKIAVAVRSAPGLVGERVRARLHREIEALCAEGVSRARVHHVLERFGPSLVPVLDDELELPSGPHVAGPAILERCLGAMADEASRLLAEGVAARASDVDVICVHGYGFPDVAGGPLHWAEQQALARRRPAERGDARRTAPSPELRNLRAS